MKIELYNSEFRKLKLFAIANIFILLVISALGNILAFTRSQTVGFCFKSKGISMPNRIMEILIKKYKNMDNKHMIDIIIKDAQEIESLTSNFSRYVTLKVPPIYIDLTMSKVKNLYTELQMLNKQDDELFELKSINDSVVKIESTLKQAHVKLNLEKEVDASEVAKTEIKDENADPPVLVNEQKIPKQLVQKREEHFLATQLKYEPIENIKEAIHLNEKIWFIKELFNGDIDYYNKTIDKLNRCAFLEEALDHIDNNFDWGYDNQTVRDFMEYVYRRYFN